MNTHNNPKSDGDEEIRNILQNAALPEPIGGNEAARERVMGKIRHTFPPKTVVPKRIFSRSGVWRSLGAGAIVAGLGLAIFLAMPEPSAEADELPTDIQMRQFYDQHEANHTAHFQEATTDTGARN
jgi:hypothetical protein